MALAKVSIPTSGFVKVNLGISFISTHTSDLKEYRRFYALLQLRLYGVGKVRMILPDLIKSCRSNDDFIPTMLNRIDSGC